MDLQSLPGTGQIATAHGLTEPQLNAIVRHAKELQPPVVSGRRRWRSEDVALLRAFLEQRSSGSQQDSCGGSA